jgi:hypothetical protein
VRSIAVLPPCVAGDWREEEKLYISLEPNFLVLCKGVDRDGELAGEGLERLLVGETTCCCPMAERVWCPSGEACCWARLRLRLSGGEVGVCCLALDRRDADGM